MSQWSKVATRTQRAQLVNYRVNAVIDKIAEPLNGLQLHTTFAVAERLYLEEKHQLYDLLRHFIAHTAGVAFNKIFLELLYLVVGYNNIAQRTEAGVDAINGRAFILQFFVEVIAAIKYRGFGCF